jgi:carbamate kinase
MIGYLIEQELGNLLPFEKPLATILTMTEVDPADQAFDDPTKFVGAVYSKDEAPACRGTRLGGQIARIVEHPWIRTAALSGSMGNPSSTRTS